MNYESLIGKRIRIIELEDPCTRYNNKEGIVECIGVDPWGDTYLVGTWGGVTIYPNVDKFEVVEKGSN